MRNRCGIRRAFVEESCLEICVPRCNSTASILSQCYRTCRSFSICNITVTLAAEKYSRDISQSTVVLDQQPDPLSRSTNPTVKGVKATHRGCFITGAYFSQPKSINSSHTTSLRAPQLTAPSSRLPSWALTNIASHSSSASQQFEAVLTTYQTIFFASPSTTKANIPKHHPGQIGAFPGPRNCVADKNFQHSIREAISKPVNLICNRCLD